MSNAAVDVLLVLAVAAQAVCTIGVLVMRSTFDRLHYAAAASTVPAFLVLAALIVREQLASQSLQAIGAVALLFLGGPVVSHAFARAARRIDYGGVEALPEEKGD